MAAAAPGNRLNQPFLQRPLPRYGRRTAVRRVTTFWLMSSPMLSSYASPAVLPLRRDSRHSSPFFNLSTDL